MYPCNASMNYRYDPRPCMLCCVMAWSTMGLKLEILGFCWPRQAKTKAKQLRPRSRHRAAFYACLSPCLDHSRCRWHMHLTTTVVLIMEETRRPPIWAPCWDKNGAGSEIYICGMNRPLRGYCTSYPKKLQNKHVLCSITKLSTSFLKNDICIV